MDCCDTIEDAVKAGSVKENEDGYVVIRVADKDGKVTEQPVEFCPWCGEAL